MASGDRPASKKPFKIVVKGGIDISHNQEKQSCTIRPIPKPPPRSAICDLRSARSVRHLFDDAWQIAPTCLCPSMCEPCTPLPLAAVGQFQACSWSKAAEGNFLQVCPCVLCLWRRGPPRFQPGGPWDFVYSQEPLVHIAPQCQCHGPGVDCREEIFDAAAIAATNGTEKKGENEKRTLAEQVDDMEVDLPSWEEAAKFPTLAIGAAMPEKPPKPTVSTLRRQRRKKLRAADPPLLPFAPR